MSAALSAELPGSSMLTYSGTRHRTGRRLNSVYCIGACAESIFLPLRVQLRIRHKRDCKRCFPPSPDFSSSTLTDLHEAQQRLDHVRDIAVRLEQENARLRDALRRVVGTGCTRYMMTSCLDADEAEHERCLSCVAADALAAAPVDGAE